MSERKPTPYTHKTCEDYRRIIIKELAGSDMSTTF